MQFDLTDRRSRWLLGIFALVFAALAVRLYDLQILRHERLSQLARAQQERTIEVEPPRGNILDCQGRPLAMNREAASFFVVPQEVSDPAATARTLAPLLGIPAERLRDRFRREREFVWLRRKLPDALAEQVRALKLPGVHELPEAMRVYPEQNLASHVLGFVGLDNQGLAGIELQYDRAIRGQSGWIRIARDAKGRRLLTEDRVHKPPVPGGDVVLTLDKVIQHIAERELENGLKKYRAQAGSVVVLRPRTGEILALANKPDFDPNQFERSSAEARRNRAITDTFEPGSTFKIVPAAAALEERICRTSEIFDCGNGQASFNGQTVRDHEPHARLNFRDVLVLSSNIGSVKIGLKVGIERMVRYARAFGFGHPTGVELPGETAGLLKPLSQWRRWTLVSASFGQGVGVTVLQLAAAYGALANQGRWVRPTLIKEVRQPESELAPAPALVPPANVISPTTADTLVSVLREVVSRGTAKEAELPQYSVAGKTGTAQKALSHGRGYDPVNNIASFVGFLPSQDPELLVVVVVDAPRDVQWGGLVAGPIFAQVAQQAVAYLGIPPRSEGTALAQGQLPSTAPPAKTFPEALSALVVVPELRGQTPSDSLRSLTQAGLSGVVVGRGNRVMAQRPAPQKWTSQSSRVVLYTGPSAGAAARTAETRVLVPDLSGQPLRNALQVLTAYGLKPRVSGSGVVHGQTPAAATWTEDGQTCWLNCQDPEAVRP